MMRTVPCFLAFCCVLRVAGQERAALRDVPFDAAHFSDADGLKQALADSRKGDRLAYKDGLDHEAAMAAYRAAEAFNPDNGDLQRRMGICLLNGPDPASALPHLQRAVELNPYLPRVHYLLGYALQLNAQWDQALAEYERHEAVLRLSPDVDPTFARTDLRMAECRAGKALSARPVTAVVTGMGPGVNGPTNDYGALPGPNGTIWFTSRRANTTGGKVNKANNIWYEDIYACEPDNGGTIPPLPVAQPLNSDHNDATVSVSADGQRMYLYRDDADGGDLFISHRNGENWSEPEALPPTVNGPGQESSAWATADGRWLYFVSNRQGGLGGSDIWRSPWDPATGNWGVAENLGGVLNSPLDEDGLCLSADGHTLWFASQGHGSMGGYDLYRSNLENGAWTRPENLGWPINSPEDDQFLVMNAEGTRGWFNSNRPGGLGGDDIYQLDMPMANASPQSADRSLLASAVGGGVLTEQQVRLIAFIKGIRPMTAIDARVELLDLDDPAFSKTMMLDTATGAWTSNAAPGRNYVVHVAMEGYLPHNQAVEAQRGEDEVALTLDMKPVTPGSREVLGSILFAPDKSDPEPVSTSELDRLAAFIMAHPDLRLEIGGHTDDQSSDQHNLDLSEARAKAVLEYLVLHGVDPGRLQAKGYGALQPLVPNDSPEHRHMNRRTEIKVL